MNINNHTIVAYRQDRLGGRLNTIICAIRIAKKYNIEFKFVWDDRTIDGEDVNPLTDLFSIDFINAFRYPTNGFEKNSAFIRVPASCQTNTSTNLINIQELCFSSHKKSFYFFDYNIGIVRFPNESIKEAQKEYAECFRDIPLRPDVNQDVNNIRYAHKGYTAIHLRRGDLLTRTDRTHFLERRYAPLTLVVNYIQKQKEIGNEKIMVFSEDTDAYELIKKEVPWITCFDKSIMKGKSTIQRAFLDIIVLSSCKEIIGTFSAFSETAANIGNISKKNILDLIPLFDQINLLEKQEYQHLKHPYDDIFLAECYKKSGDIGKAIDVTQAIISKHPNNPLFLLYLGKLYAQQNNMDKALSFMKESVALDPESWEPKKILADTCLNKKDFHAAIEPLEDLVSLCNAREYKTNNVINIAIEVLQKLFQAYIQIGQKEKAIKAAKHMLDYDGMNPEVILTVTSFLLQTGAINDTEVILRDAIRKIPDNNSLHFHLGNVLLKKQAYPSALEAFQVSAQKNPNHLESYQGVCLCLFHLQQYDKAMHIASQLIHQAPQNPALQDWYQKFSQACVKKNS